VVFFAISFIDPMGVLDAGSVTASGDDTIEHIFSS